MPIIGQISVGDGATFTPSVSSDGELSWTNNKNLPNPATVDIPQAVMDRYQIAPIASPAFTGNPTAPTPEADDDSAKIATTEFVQAELEDYLALSGGTMTGAISTSSTDFISKTNNTTHLTIAGGSAYSNSASIRLAGGDETGQTGLFQLRAQDGTIYKDFVGKPDGTLTWGGSNVITAAGGTMTGNISFDKEEGRISLASAQNEAGRLRLLGGSGITNGAQLLLSGKSHSSTAGQFQLGTHDGTNSASLIGKPDGTLTWGGVRIAFEYLGPASTGVATNFTLPSTGWWLVVCGHNSTPGLNGIFAVRTGGNMAFKLAGAGSISMTCSGATITVTPSGGAIQVAGLQIPIA